MRTEILYVETSNDYGAYKEWFKDTTLKISHHPTAPAVLWNDGDHLYAIDTQLHNALDAAERFPKIGSISWILQNVGLLSLKYAH